MEKAKAEFTKYERQDIRPSMSYVQNEELWFKIDIKLREDIKHMKSQEKKLEATIKGEEKKVQDTERNIEIQTLDIEKYEKELVQAEKTLKKEEAELEAVFFVFTWFYLLIIFPKVYESIKGEVADYNVELAAKQKEFFPWSKKLNDAQEKVDVGQSEIELLRNKVCANVVLLLNSLTFYIS